MTMIIPFQTDFENNDVANNQLIFADLVSRVSTYHAEFL